MKSPTINYQVIQDDAFAAMDVMAMMGEQFHAIVTDPPYGLGAWDWITHGHQLHEWHQKWAGLALALVPPGGHMAVFSGTRHFHHMMLAVESAGWELRDTLLWLKAGGMPKSRNRDGYGTGLKPSWEPIALFRKPLEGTIFATFDKYETGMLHIDAARLAPGDGKQRDGEDTGAKSYKENSSVGFAFKPGERGGSAKGRWPTNVLLDEAAAETLDQQTGVSGGASRFFYVSKAAPSERELGLIGHVSCKRCGGIDTEQHQDGSKGKCMRNDHPTVKPIKLMQYINRLLTIPGGRILDPFAGSGSGGCGAVQDGFGWVGIEQDDRSAQIARYRVDYWASL